MMFDWNKYRAQLAAGVKELGQLSPETVKGYVELSSAGLKKDLLGAKMRELISLAVAVTLRCDHCAYPSRNTPRRNQGRDRGSVGRRGVGKCRCGARLLHSGNGRRPRASEHGALARGNAHEYHPNVRIRRCGADHRVSPPHDRRRFRWQVTGPRRDRGGCCCQPAISGTLKIGSHIAG